MGPRYSRAVGRSAPHGDPALIERDGEQAGIERAVRAAAGGEGAVLVLEGPAGIGKTELLMLAASRARAAGLTSLSARGAEIERDFAWGIVRQLFEPPVAGAAAAEREEILAGAARLAVPVVAAPEPHGASADARVSADRTFATVHGLYWLAANMAQHQPLALVVDDVHWADVASLGY